jgi:hypothetical protein
LLMFISKGLQRKMTFWVFLQGYQSLAKTQVVITEPNKVIDISTPAKIDIMKRMKRQIRLETELLRNMG